LALATTLPLPSLTVPVKVVVGVGVVLVVVGPGPGPLPEPPPPPPQPISRKTAKKTHQNYEGASPQAFIIDPVHSGSPPYIFSKNSIEGF